MVEFSIVVPLFLLLVFGIIEFGWAFGQHLDVRHGARETSRLVAVDYRPSATMTPSAQSQAIITEACSRMDLAGGAVLTLDRPPLDAGAIGSAAQISVAVPLDTLTGAFDVALGGVVLRSSVDVRLEQRATWIPATGTCPG